MNPESELLPQIDQLPADHRSGFIAVIGRPNVGKSTLFNRILEQKIAITSPKPQTTRDQLMGIYTVDDAQLIFLDTPGIHNPENKLGEFMMNVVSETITDADIVLWLVDVSVSPTDAERHIAGLLRELDARRSIKRLVLGLNKLDLFQPDLAPDADTPDSQLHERIQEYLSLVNWLSNAEQGTADRSAAHSADFEPLASEPLLSYLPLSAKTGDGSEPLLRHLRSLLPEGPRYYPEEHVTDLSIRFIAEEIIREKALSYLDQEVPHSIAVVIDEFTRRNAKMTYISATIYVERESQKKIVLGKGGSMIKRIGKSARPEIEDLVETKIYLELWVKVWEKWRRRPGMLQRLGYAE